MQHKTILGIDPGTREMGLAVIRGPKLLSYGVRFSRPVVVPDDGAGATLTVSGIVEDKLDGNRVVVGLTATVGDGKVLTGAKAVVRLP